MPDVQDVIARRYRLEELVGGGGMGQVWRATDTVLGREVAVKILSDRMAEDAGFAARFRDEARTMAGLRHANVAAVFDYGEPADDCPPYLVMAYVEGQPLDEHIAAAGRLGAAETASIVAQAARALDAVHRAGVIHRDVKPANLILQPDGTVVLVDFGVARSPRSAQLTGVDEIIGTAAYMAPEQVTKQPLTPVTDVYALGAVAYQCLAGRPPFAGDNPLMVAMRHLNDQAPPLPDDVPDGMRRLVAMAMAKNPAERFPSAEAMAAAADALPHDDTALEADQRAAAERAARAAGPGAAAGAGVAAGALGAGAAGAGALDAVNEDGPTAPLGGAARRTAMLPVGPPDAAPPGRRVAAPRRRARRLWLAAVLALVVLGGALAAASLLGDSGKSGDGPPSTPAATSAGPASARPGQPAGTGGPTRRSGRTSAPSGGTGTTPPPAATTGASPRSAPTTPAGTSGPTTGGTGGQQNQPAPSSVPTS